MKIMLVCVAGMSTSLVTSKMQAYANEKGMDVHIEAHPIQEYREYMNGVDVVLLGPQISYKLGEVQSQISVPCAVINTMDYGTANAKAIIKGARKLLKEQEGK